jgi:hypothetical protein
MTSSSDKICPVRSTATTWSKLLDQSADHGSAIDTIPTVSRRSVKRNAVTKNAKLEVTRNRRANARTVASRWHQFASTGRPDHQAHCFFKSSFPVSLPVIVDTADGHSNIGCIQNASPPACARQRSMRTTLDFLQSCFGIRKLCSSGMIDFIT